MVLYRFYTNRGNDRVESTIFPFDRCYMGFSYIITYEIPFSKLNFLSRSIILREFRISKNGSFSTGHPVSLYIYCFVDFRKWHRKCLWLKGAHVCVRVYVCSALIKPDPLEYLESISFFIFYVD